MLDKKDHHESCFRISIIEISFDLLVVSFQFSFAFSFTLRFAVCRLVMVAFACDSYLLCSSLPFIFFLFHRVKNFPHLSNLSSDFRDSIPWEFVFDLWVDVHTIEEKRAHGFLRWLWLVKISFSAHTFS